MTAQTLETLGITAESIKAYDKRIPRYTSYPTAPFFTEEFGPADWSKHLRDSSDKTNDLSLYVHVPFCQKRCLFCGCNVIVARKEWVADEYLDLFEREVELLRQDFKGTGKVIQLHLGGGTPNYLTHAQMKRLLQILERNFDFDPNGERSIEVDPRLAKPEDIERFYHEHGYRRISFGTQDFNVDTQEAIGRGQTFDVTFANVEAARKIGFRSVNIDLIYGLPRQTVATWNDTIENICRLRPDRIALYNFAYLPGKLPHQRTLKEEELPAAEEKLEMFIKTHDRLTQEGWEFIGMDHYALKDDSLTKAQKAGTLRRNFMGYTTLRGTDLIAFGVSSISDFQNAFVQNVKKLTTYRDMIKNGQLPVERGLMLSDDDRVRRYMIEELMCNSILRFDVPPPVEGFDIKAMVTEEAEQLKPLEADGLIEVGDDALRVTKKGQMFLRNIAVVFDAYMKKAGKTVFSRAV